MEGTEWTVQCFFGKRVFFHDHKISALKARQSFPKQGCRHGAVLSPAVVNTGLHADFAHSLQNTG